MSIQNERPTVRAERSKKHETDSLRDIHSAASERDAIWPRILAGVWLVLLALVVVAISGGKSMSDDVLALPSLALFVASALLGSRVWLLVTQRRERATGPDAP